MERYPSESLLSLIETNAKGCCQYFMCTVTRICRCRPRMSSPILATLLLQPQRHKQLLLLPSVLPQFLMCSAVEAASISECLCISTFECVRVCVVWMRTHIYIYTCTHLHQAVYQALVKLARPTSAVAVVLQVLAACWRQACAAKPGLSCVRGCWRWVWLWWLWAQPQGGGSGPGVESAIVA